MKTAIVTGSASGIGAATAIELARRGWHVVVNYSKSKEGAEQIHKKCPNSIVVQANVGEDADCRRLAKAALDKWGQIDALVNNAGTTKFVAHPKLDELSAEDFLNIYRVNVVAAFLMTRACAEALKAATGAVVNIGSLASFIGTGSSIAYAASKGAVNTLTMSLARVLGPEVRVNAVLPGFVDTRWMIAGYGAERYKELAERYAGNAPLRSTCKPEDIADAVVWLLEGGRMVTGETLLVDAGFHLATPR